MDSGPAGGDKPVEVTGWGRAIRSYSRVRQARSALEIEQVFEQCGKRGSVPRGLGRSYGDAAQNSGGTAIRLESDGRWELKRRGDPASLVLGGGEVLADVLAYLVPQGLMLPVLPGTALVTVGGAIAADVHGKNHHVGGSFADCVESIRLSAPAGEQVVERNSDEFRATAGGMGMTGVITEATLRLEPIETSAVLVDTDRARDLDELMSMMSESDEAYRYSVAWVDLMPKSRGRGVLTRANPAPRSAISAGDLPAYAPQSLPPIPDVVPSWALRPLAVRAFNSAWYHRAPATERARAVSIPAFFHPLDAVGDWNRVYGRRGFIQYQFVVPFGCEETLRRIVETMQSRNLAVYLVVLKRMGPANDCFLSFPIPGWTLALDFPVGQQSLGDTLGECDELVAEAGGRIYLAKDACSSPAAVHHMYPMLDRWRSVRARLDPDGVLASDLTRRLALI